MQSERKKLILIGAGSRGKTYTDNSKLLEGMYEVVAVAEPVEDRRSYIQREHGIPDSLCFESWEPLLSMPKLADAAIIATMDRDHLAPTLEAIRKGYDILLEKPVCPTPEECYVIEREAEKYGVRILVCHVLRYTTFFRAIKRLIDNGTLGRIVNVQHREDVGHVHQSHSFVRGNWGNEERSSCMILQKCCHDMDILQWLVGKKCKKVQSFGSLSYFTRENAPEGAPERCIDGCPHGDTCPYNSVKLYLKSDSKWFRRSSTQLIDPTDADVERALRETQYGKCVYKCDNNVVDHQVVNLEFEDGLTMTFSMCAFNRGGRELRIMGTKGELYAAHGDSELTLFDLETRTARKIPVEDNVSDQSILGGHGGGDTGIMLAFYDMLIATSCDNHMIVFAAEEARLSGTVIDLDEYKKTKKESIM